MFFNRNDGPGGGRDKRVLPLLPLRDIIVFPHMVVPLFVGREKSINALEEAMGGDKEILLAAQRKAKTNDPTPQDIFEMGTIGTIIQLLRLPDGTVKVLVEGKQRARIERFVPNEEFFLCEVEQVDELSQSSVEVEALMRSVQTTFESYVKLNKRIPPEMLMTVQTIDDAARLADTIVVHLSSIKLNDRQEILETTDPIKRLERLYELMNAEIEILQVEKKIRSRVKKQMEKTQKEYYLNEQMQAIQKELGERDEFKNEIQELEDKIKTKKLSKEGSLKVKKELKKLKMMQPMSAEATVVRNYIDWVLGLPWYDKTEENYDLGERRADPQRGSLRPEQDQRAHPRVSRGAGAGEEAQGAGAVSGGAARRRQDLARQEHRALHGPQVRAPVARRRARRGRDSRPSAHVHRRAARPHRAVAAQGRLQQSGVPARRDRQDVERLPW